MTTYSSKTLLETEKWVRLKKERYKRIQSKSISGSYFTFILPGRFLVMIAPHCNVRNFYFHFLIHISMSAAMFFYFWENNCGPHLKGTQLCWYVRTDGACWNSVLPVQNIRDLCSNNDFKIKTKRETSTTSNRGRETSSKSKGAIIPCTIVKPRWVP